MILTQKDVDEFIEEYSDYQLDYEVSGLATMMPSEESVFRFYKWLTNNPQVIMTAGFQEYVGAYKLPLYRSLVRKGLLSNCARPVFREFQGEWILISSVDSNAKFEWEGFSIEGLKGYQPQEDNLDEVYALASRPICCAEQVISKAQRMVHNEVYDSTVFVSPKLWTPFNQKQEKELLQSASREIIRELQAENVELRSIRWQVFEEVVAEILRSKGMEIHLVRESPQGGRDIIARGELIPGMEPLTIAVEVKHMDLVDRPLIQQALYQNRHFPALMFVTSGRFTSGVIKEARMPTNRMRLFLKDGVAIRDLIKSYKFSW